MGRHALRPGLARSSRIEAKITPSEREGLTARRGKMTESDAIRAAVVAWCTSGFVDGAPENNYDQRLVALVEKAAERGFLSAMHCKGSFGKDIAAADPIAQEERAALLAALANEREETLAARLGLTARHLAAIRNMRPRAPRLTDEQRSALGLQAVRGGAASVRHASRAPTKSQLRTAARVAYSARLPAPVASTVERAVANLLASCAIS
jgi:hypothetical protein